MRKPFIFMLLLLVTYLSACAAEIGDTCSSSANCPPSAICDSTAPKGYCTIPQCTRNSCTKEAVCIKFDDLTSYCMKHCESDDDCRRSGYACKRSIDGIGYCYTAAKS